MNQVVITQVASTPRGLPAEKLGELAEEIFGDSRVTVVPRLDDAIERAVALAEVDIVGSAGVLISGSVIAISEARALLVRQEPVAVPAASPDLDDEWDADYSEDGHETDRDWR
jgi:dihydrofolate synthase / folylpolyglutamate synthase